MFFVASKVVWTIIEPGNLLLIALGIGAGLVLAEAAEKPD